ncbi:unnamed protein product [Wuchereria bancrofti]|uniref:Uncharacterized protein n=1 Tax=Wuchereria bancrofti TaxID=6293 RepID=A0A3P7DYT5_WUCBA|nr:unnamed protein product [Wuchereria bancrofti]
MIISMITLNLQVLILGIDYRIQPKYQHHYCI